MEAQTTSNQNIRIHNVPLKHPVRRTPFGRSFAETTDGRQWTKHDRDRNKIHGGWVELQPFATKQPLPSALAQDGLISDLRDDKTLVEVGAGVGVESLLPESSAISTEYGDQDIDGELQLHLVLMYQTEGELEHWALFVGRESGTGDVLQVKGDWLKMHYAPERTSNLFMDDNYIIARIYTVASTLTPKQVLLIQETAESTAPPESASAKSINGNCQTWCCDVLGQLVQLGVANPDMVAALEAMRLDGGLQGASRSNAIKAMLGGKYIWVNKDIDGGLFGIA